MKYKCYTIGHSRLELDEFLKLLQNNKINCVIDVRSTPYSKFSPQFNKEDIKEYLKKHKIIYENFVEEFGARRKEREYYTVEGKVNFNKVIDSDIFKKGVKRIIKGIEKNYVIALMCSEKDPLECHRFSMIARGFKKYQIMITHILSDGFLLENEELEKKLVRKYNPNYNQLNLTSFFNGQKEARISTFEELLEKSYIQINQDIGFGKTEEEEEE